jgi:hypothetical protein
LFPPGTPTGARDDLARYEQLLVTPFTLERVLEVTRLDGMCEDLLREAKNIAKASQESLRIQENAKEY